MSHKVIFSLIAVAAMSGLMGYGVGYLHGTDPNAFFKSLEKRGFEVHHF